MSWTILLALVLITFIVVAALVALAVLANVKGKTENTGGIQFPYEPAEPLFSAAERLFLGVLDQAVGSQHRVFGKVRVADVAAVRSGLTPSVRQRAVNRIAFKHFDYVVCRASDLSVVCAVELNDKSHAGRKAQARDELLANVCRVINLPLVTIAAKSSYSSQEVRAQFVAAVDRAPASIPVLR